MSSCRMIKSGIDMRYDTFEMTIERNGDEFEVEIEAGIGPYERGGRDEPPSQDFEVLYAKRLDTGALIVLTDEEEEEVYQMIKSSLNEGRIRKEIRKAIEEQSFTKVGIEAKRDADKIEQKLTDLNHELELFRNKYHKKLPKTIEKAYALLEKCEELYDDVRALRYSVDDEE